MNQKLSFASPISKKMKKEDVGKKYETSQKASLNVCGHVLILFLYVKVYSLKWIKYSFEEYVFVSSFSAFRKKKICIFNGGSCNGID